MLLRSVLQGGFFRFASNYKEQDFFKTVAKIICDVIKQWWCLLFMHESLSDWKTYSLAGTEQEVQFIADALQLPRQSSILDLYCGYGRHAIELAKRGYKMTGIDANQQFIDLATQRAQAEAAEVVFRQCDMRELDYCNDFHAVINMFAAFGYFTDEENGRVLKRVARALKPGGLFLIDLLNREWMMKNSLNRYWKQPNGEHVLSYKVELRQGIATMRRQLTNQITGAKTESEFFLRAYSLPEMTDILREAGLIIATTYGGFDCRPYDAEAPRMIILAQKPPVCLAT